MPDPDEALDQLLRRLRSLSARAWAAGGRRDAVRRLTATLVELGEPGHPLPDLPDHVQADVVVVLAREATANGRRDEVAAAVARALEETR